MRQSSYLTIAAPKRPGILQRERSSLVSTLLPRETPNVDARRLPRPPRARRVTDEGYRVDPIVAARIAKGEDARLAKEKFERDRVVLISYLGRKRMVTFDRPPSSMDRQDAQRFYIKQENPAAFKRLVRAEGEIEAARKENDLAKIRIAADARRAAINGGPGVDDKFGRGSDSAFAQLMSPETEAGLQHVADVTGLTTLTKMLGEVAEPVEKAMKAAGKWVEEVEAKRPTVGNLLRRAGAPEQLASGVDRLDPTRMVPHTKFATDLVGGIAGKIARPREEADRFTNSVGSVLDPNATFEERAMGVVDFGTAVAPIVGKLVKPFAIAAETSIASKAIRDATVARSGMAAKIASRPQLVRPSALAKAGERISATSVATGEGLDGLISTYRRAGAFASRKEEAALRKVAQMRAKAWSRETGRPAKEFYQGLKSQLDGPRPAGSLAQGEGAKFAPHSAEVDPVYAETAELRGHLGRKTTPVAFTISDLARTGTATLPSGAKFEMHGGPMFRVPGFDIHYGDGLGWASDTHSAALAHHRRAAGGAPIHFGLANRPENVLASHGLLAVKAEVEHAVLQAARKVPGAIPMDVLLAHIQKTVRAYNETKLGMKRPLAMPRTVGEFVRSIEHNTSVVDTFNRRIEFAQKFWPNPNKPNADSPFQVGWDSVAHAMTDPGALRAGKGTSDVVNAILVDPHGMPVANTRHPVYEWGVQGKNLGLTTQNKLSDLVPVEFMRAEEARFLTQKNPKSNPSRAEIASRAKGHLLMGGDPGGFVRKGIIEVPTENILPFLRQNGADGGAKAWYDASTRTIGAITGRPDASSLVHELFHDWSRSLRAEHTMVLERHFGMRGTVGYEERSARAFERYLRDGAAPSESVRRVFATIREAMVRIYAGLKGSPIERAIHPEVRATFDGMLGGTRATGRSRPRR